LADRFSFAARTSAWGIAPLERVRSRINRPAGRFAEKIGQTHPRVISMERGRFADAASRLRAAGCDVGGAKLKIQRFLEAKIALRLGSCIADDSVRGLDCALGTGVGSDGMKR
jgi:hypothetical protein